MRARSQMAWVRASTRMGSLYEKRWFCASTCVITDDAGRGVCGDTGRQMDYYHPQRRKYQAKPTRAWSTRVRASGISPDMAAPMCVSTSIIFSTL